MLFRLIIDHMRSFILIRCETEQLLQHYIDDIGDDGNKLYEIISCLVDGYTSISIAGIEPTIGQDDTVIGFNMYK